MTTNHPECNTKTFVSYSSPIPKFITTAILDQLTYVGRVNEVGVGPHFQFKEGRVGAMRRLGAGQRHHDERASFRVQSLVLPVQLPRAHVLLLVRTVRVVALQKLAERVKVRTW